MKIKIHYYPFLFLTLLFFSCANEPATTEKKSAFNDLYELSEMAQLMEDMYGEMKDVRTLVLDEKSMGEKPAYFDKIHTAEMTEDFRHDEIFDQFAKGYLYNVDILYDAHKEISSKEAFNNVVNACIQCHKSEVGCFGPVSRISKLHID